LKNLDTFLASVEKVQARKGLSASAIAVIKQKITQEVATTTDLRAAFMRELEQKSKQTAHTSPFGTFVAAIRASFGKIFSAPRALASSGTPFGGALLFSFFCEDSESWMITIEPLPPSYVALLSYEPFSQAYLSYNIPETSWLLGYYSPVGICVFACPYCVEIETEGTITPVVGSSAL
jgi:hypothetical protein